MREGRFNAATVRFRSLKKQRKAFGPPGGHIRGVNVDKKFPCERSLQWATRSASTKPGGASSQSWKVRKGICSLSRGLACVVPHLREAYGR